MIRFAARAVEAFALVSIILFVVFTVWATFWGQGVNPIENFADKVGQSVVVVLHTIQSAIDSALGYFLA